MRKPRRKSPQLTDEQVFEVYHDYYIGESMGLVECASLIGTNHPDLKKACDQLNLRLRNKLEVARARWQRGEPWVWAEQAIEKDRAQRPQARPPATRPIPIGNNRYLIPHNTPAPAAKPAEAKPLPATLPSNITAIIRELKAAGAEVQVHITLQLEIPQ